MTNYDTTKIEAEPTCDTCGQSLAELGTGLLRDTQCGMCWESECADSFWRQQHGKSSWEKDND